MKWNLVKVLCVCCVLLTACGNQVENQVQSKGFSMDTDSGFVAENNSAGIEDAVGIEEFDSGVDEGAETIETGAIDTEKLVYSGNITIDTMDFDKAVDELHDMISKSGGFVEYESIYDNGGGMVYYDEEDEISHTYTATIRIESSKYDEFTSNIGGIGDIRSQSSNVGNITQQYSTTKEQLEIYQTKYNRYKELLAKAGTVEEMFSIEREITEIEVKLVEYNTALSVMDTDVAYSSIDIIINEILRKSDIRNKNTFLVRLKEVCSDSVEGVLAFLEGCLFFIIRYFWYIGFVVIIYVVCKKFKLFKFKLKRPKLFRYKKIENNDKNER